MTEADIRKKIKALKELYMAIFWFILGNILFTLIWFAFDRSEPFWPKYTFLVWGIVLLVEAYGKGIFPLFTSYISFLTPEWEEEKVSEMMRPRYDQHRIRLNRDEK